MTEEPKRKKVRDIIREIQEENPQLLQDDNALCIEVWEREGYLNGGDVILHGSPAGTILRARNYILQKG